ncbi:MAG TPA: CHC2 zinc finger domain-containing protein [Anaerolineales bacterium]|nr:CHC2 zinc finger domain-containing protein [Anaerolineales bacterium]
MLKIEISSDFDLIALVSADLGPGRKHGRWTLFRCPFHHDHTPSLAVTNGDERGAFWRCFGCHKQGGAIKWFQEYRHLSFSEAVQAVQGQDIELGVRREMGELPPPMIEHPPDPRWQVRAWKLVERARDTLWKTNTPIRWPVSDPQSGTLIWQEMTPLEYLLGRGLSETTLRLWQIGYIPTTFYDSSSVWGLDGQKVWIPQGILIPCIVGNHVWYLKIRRPMPKPHKYTQIRGSRPAVYLVQTLEGHKKAAFCEGELDTLLLWQECDALIAAVSLGSAGNELHVPTWGLHFLHVEARYTAYDLDQSGASGAEKLAWLTPHSLSIPKLRPHDKDLTDFYLSGGNLREWLKAEIAKSR